MSRNVVEHVLLHPAYSLLTPVEHFRTTPFVLLQLLEASLSILPRRLHILDVLAVDVDVRVSLDTTSLTLLLEHFTLLQYL